MRTLILLLASGGFVGYIPVASGTFGSLVGIPLFWGFDALRLQSTPLYLFVFVALTGGSCWLAARADEILQEHDSHRIVIDEIVGYLAATLFLGPTWPHAIAAFFIFRVLDVIKPFPAGYIDEQVPGGAGVVLDDVVSGLYTNAIVRLLILFGVLS